MVRLVHAYFIQHDWDIYSDTFDKTASVRNSKLNEMMGQVKYVFADKTGTLTKNRLSFVKLCVNGRVYAPEEDADGLRDMLLDKGSGLTRDELALYRGMFLGMALCHSVIPQLEAGGKSFSLVGSPDEKAVLEGAKR